MKTSDLSGAPLDWAVAKAAGRTLRYMPMGLESGHGWWIWEETPNGTGGIVLDKSVYMPVGPCTKPKTTNSREVYSPSTDWSLSGPIIHRECISMTSPTNSLTAFWCADIGLNREFTQYDHDPLTAAMRCFVASKLGDEVEIITTRTPIHTLKTLKDWLADDNQFHLKKPDLEAVNGLDFFGIRKRFKLNNGKEVSIQQSSGHCCKDSVEIYLCFSSPLLESYGTSEGGCGPSRVPLTVAVDYLNEQENL